MGTAPWNGPCQMRLVASGIVLALAFVAQCRLAVAQEEVNAQSFAPGPGWWLPTEEGPLPEPEVDAEPFAPGTPGALPFGTPQSPTPGEIRVNADYTARAAIVGDTTRLASFAKGTFLPSAIPAEGQPFFGSDSRANVQGSGSAVSLSAVKQRSYAADYSAMLYAELALEDLSIGTADSGETNVVVREIFGTFNRLTVGITESEFADPSAMPEVLDRAGPNARITVFDAGVGEGQGILSYRFLSDEPEGLEIVGSIEQAIPEINSPPGDEAFAHYPDLVIATQYVAGDYLVWNPIANPKPKFYERWHVQWASVARDLGRELPNADSENEFGWGTAFSGAYRFVVNPNLRSLDRVMFSAAYGEGLSHYITDINAADDTGDAVINAAGELEALPVFAAYVAYTHQWTDCLRSTATLSHVNLDSTTVLGASGSPYRSGDFLAVNLVYHLILRDDTEKEKGERFYTGIEYLYGQKEALNGTEGDAHRVLFLVALRK